jgi:hypothetical protein
VEREKNYCAGGVSGTGTTVYGTVDVDEASTSTWYVTFSVTYRGNTSGSATPAETWVIADPTNASVGINVLGATSVTVQTSGTSDPSNWGASVASGTGTLNSGTGDIAGQNGNFLDYAECSTDDCGATVTLIITGTALSLGNNSDGFLAALYAVEGDPDHSVWGTNTSEVASPTLLPATLPLFAGGLGFVGYLTKRRKQNAKQALARPDQEHQSGTRRDRREAVFLYAFMLRCVRPLPGPKQTRRSASAAAAFGGNADAPLAGSRSS